MNEILFLPKRSITTKYNKTNRKSSNIPISMTLSYIKRNQFYECIFKAVELKNKTTVTIERKEEETVINFFQLIIFYLTHTLKKNDQLLL